MQPESAHISSDLPQCFSIDPTDASVGPLSVGVQTQAEGLFMRQDRSPKGQDPRNEGLGSREPSRTPVIFYRKTKAPNLKYSRSTGACSILESQGPRCINPSALYSATVSGVTLANTCVQDLVATGAPPYLRPGLFCVLPIMLVL